MAYRALLLLVLFLPSPSYAVERLILNFELTYPDGRSEVGRTYSYNKEITWSHGIKKSYLTLSCKELKPGKYERLYSTVDHFSGIRISHKIVDNILEIQVFRQLVKPGLEEIRALPVNTCKDIHPVVNSSSEKYRFTAIGGLNEVRSFGKDMTFRIRLTEFDK